MATVDKNFTCDVCGKVLTHKSLLRLHLSTHKGRKTFLCNVNTFPCNVCEKSFSCKNDLFRHMETHTHDLKFKCNAKFKCNVCAKGFPYMALLSLHMSTHKGKKNLKGNVCGKKFSQKCFLTQRMEHHTGEWTFKCDICGKGFSQKGHLTQHMGIHTREEKFKCEICAKGFSQKLSFVKHMISHTGENDIKCIACEKQYVSVASLCRHMTIHTSTPNGYSSIGELFKYLKNMELNSTIWLNEKYVTSDPLKTENEMDESEAAVMADVEYHTKDPLEMETEEIYEMESKASTLAGGKSFTAADGQKKIEPSFAFLNYSEARNDHTLTCTIREDSSNLAFTTCCVRGKYNDNLIEEKKELVKKEEKCDYDSLGKFKS